VSILLIVSHPKTGSLNHAAADHMTKALLEEGRTVWSHDLYEEHFQPVLENDEIQRRFSFDEVFTRHTRELKEANGVILIYPDWWGMPPAILKGWIDRIFRPGFAFDYTGEEFLPKERVPLLSNKRAIVVNTTNETNPLSQESMYALWRERVFGYVGIDQVYFKTLYNVRETTGRQRREWLGELDALARQVF
jgi:putative NADPH-quinone reductase